MAASGSQNPTQDLSLQQAVDVARTTEGVLDPAIAAFLDNAVNLIWNNIQLFPEAYVMDKNEFAVFNFYRDRFDGVVFERAVDRYWRNIQSDGG